jgi:23S rRNA (uracil1939-C5)-methyltransferase
VVLDDRRARFARATLLRVLEEGPDRVEPRCDVFGRCGGCEWQHVSYSAQLRAKADLIRAALDRIGGFESGAVDVMPSPLQYGYRHRARVACSNRGVGFRERRSHRVCAIEECPVLAAPLNAALAGLARRSGEALLLAGGDGAVAVGASGDPVEIAVAGDSLSVSPGVFVQSNCAMLGALVGAVCAAAEVSSAEASSASGGRGALLELYAGAGFFTLSLARAFERIWAVEANEHATRDLENNLHTAGIANVRVSTDGAGDLVDEFVAFAPDVVFLDPPRVGITPELAACLGELSARRIVYLSCDPATLARDLRLLHERAFRLVEVQGFDLFPQTSHVETLAVLDHV